MSSCPPSPPLLPPSINNVSHVGHAHPGVAAAVAAQLGTLNTNSRYLHDAYVDYAEAMAALCPDPLQVRVHSRRGGLAACHSSWASHRTPWHWFAREQPTDMCQACHMSAWGCHMIGA